MVVGFAGRAYSHPVLRSLTIVACAVCAWGCGSTTSEAQLADEASDLSVRRVDVYETDYPEPEPELSKTGSTVAMPQVPGFPSIAKGPLRPDDVLRIRRSLLGKTITIRGTLSWRFDCVDQNYRPNVSRAEVQRFVRANPDRCKPTQLALARGLKDGAPTVWAIGGPASLGLLRRGARVEVRGRWTESGPGGVVHPGGLLVVERIAPTR